METVSATDWFCVLVIATVIAYDLFALSLWGVRGTVSHTVIWYTRRYFWIAFLLGVLVGHWIF